LRGKGYVPLYVNQCCKANKCRFLLISMWSNPDWDSSNKNGRNCYKITRRIYKTCWSKIGKRHTGQDCL